MKTVLSSGVAAALLALLPGVSQAQHGSGHSAGAQHAHQAAGETHAHKSPHGGVVRTAGAYHLELVAQPQALRIYLLDGKEAPLAPAGVSGSVLLLSTANKTYTVPLTVSGDHVVAKLPAGTVLRTAVVSLKTNGQALSARFDKLDVAPAGGKATGATYICPMQCAGSASRKPGACPVCGMALVKKA